MKKELKRFLFIGLIVAVLILGTGCGVNTFTDSNGASVYFPIAKGLFWKGGIWDFLVYPMAYLMSLVARITGQNYAVTILITTLLIRSLAWPIYGKTNDMSLKMKLLAPEQAKIEAKYKDKTDKESQQRKSMETMALYKKYKVSFTSCLMPLVQMPIFLAFYETLRRIPYTTVDYLASTTGIFTNKKGVEFLVENLIYDFGKLNTNLFGIDLLLTAKEGGSWQRWGVYILAALVTLTQLGTQLLTQRRTKKQSEKLESDIPEYRRTKQNDQQKQSESMMKIMMYMMPVMMAIFVVQSTAALGWYWLVGNLFTAFQTFISSRNSEKRLQKLKQKYEEKERFYYTR